MSVGSRWLRFTAVGVLGFLVQTSTLTILLGWTGLGASAAIAIAVLAAVSHNFVWHEHFTYPGRPREWRAARWLWFMLSAGLFAVISNIGLTTLVMILTGLPVVVSNAIAAAGASALNFALNDRIVFRAWSC